MTKYPPIAALMIMTLWPGLASAQSIEEPAVSSPRSCPRVTWSNLQRTVLNTFENGPGQRAALLEAGAQSAERAVSGRLQSIDISAGAEFPIGDQAWAERDQGVEASLNIQLGDLATRLKQSWQAEASAERAQARADYWEFDDAALRAYLTAWVQTAVALRSEQTLAKARNELEPLRVAAQKQIISRLDLLDLEAEIGRLSTEHAQDIRQARDATARLAATLGQPCVQVDASTLDPAQVSAPTASAPNPWTPLLAKIDTHPLVQTHQAQATLAATQARAARAAAPWEVSIGAGLYTSGLDPFWPVAQLGLSIPLGNPDAAEAERLQASAAAHRADAGWQIRQVRAELERLRDGFDAATRQLESMESTWLAPLSERQELLEQAYKQRQVTLERVIRGRREVIDARKQIFLVRAELFMAQRRAGLLHTLASTLSAQNDLLAPKNTEQSP